MKNPVFQLADTVRETAYSIHRYLGPGHLEKVYENALVHRLMKLGISALPQASLTVFDEDGAVIGEYLADIVVNKQLILEIKAVKAIADEHIAQILGYLRASRIEHGAILNFGSSKFQIRMFAMSESLHQSGNREI